MKKIVSLFIALTLVLGASAVPQKQAVKLANQATTLQVVKKGLPSGALKRLEMGKEGQRAMHQVVKPLRKVAADEPITITGNNLEEDEYWGFPYIYGGNEDYTVEATFWGDKTFGTYKQGDEDLEIIIFDNMVEDDYGVWLDFTTAEYKQTEKGLYFYAIGTGEDDNLYEIILTRYAPEQPKDTIKHEFAAAKGDFYSDEAIYFAYATDTKFDCGFAINGFSVKDGKYVGDALVKDYTYVQTIDGTDTTYVGSYYTASVDVKVNESSYTFTLSYFAADSFYYMLTMPVERYVPAKDTVKHELTGKTYVTYYGETKDYYIYVDDKNFTVTLDILGKKLAGTFTAENGDFDTYYTSAYQIVGKDTTLMAYRQVEAVITENKDDYTIVANFYMKADNAIHQFKATYIKPAAKETKTLDIADAKFADYRDWYGDYYILAAPSDSSVIFLLDIYSIELEGTFTEQDLGAEYTMVVDGDKTYGIDLANLNFALNTDETAINIKGDILASNSVLYKVTIFCPIVEQPSAINSVVEMEKIKTTKILRNGQILIVKDGQLYNLLGTKVE